jgi:hypothetical protein
VEENKMKSRFFLTILLAIALLALPSLACSITVSYTHLTLPTN